MKKEMRYLVPGDYMADPAVHVFNNRVYIYPSHDWESGIEENDNGDHFNMKDYHVFSTDDIMNGEIKDHGVVLQVEDIPWAGRQLWDCDVARKDGKYYMYFPLKDQNDIFRIGVAVSDNPEGPFVPQANPMKGSYSIDPASWIMETVISTCISAVCGVASCNAIATIKLWNVPFCPKATNRLSPLVWPNSAKICWNLQKSRKPLSFWMRMANL